MVASIKPHRDEVGLGDGLLTTRVPRDQAGQGQTGQGRRASAEGE